MKKISLVNYNRCNIIVSSYTFKKKGKKCMTFYCKMNLNFHSLLLTRTIYTAYLARIYCLWKVCVYSISFKANNKRKHWNLKQKSKAQNYINGWCVLSCTNSAQGCYGNWLDAYMISGRLLLRAKRLPHSLCSFFSRWQWPQSDASGKNCTFPLSSVVTKMVPLSLPWGWIRKTSSLSLSPPPTPLTLSTPSQPLPPAPENLAPLHTTTPIQLSFHTGAHFQYQFDLLSFHSSRFILLISAESESPKADVLNNYFNRIV